METPVPDGGWGWVVVVSSFILYVIVNGATYSYGVILVELLTYFNSTEVRGSFIGSMQVSIMNLMGFAAGSLGKSMGWRTVVVLGSILSGLGFSVSALAPDIYVLYLTYGLVTGVGNGFMYSSAKMCFHGYFNKKRALASGLAVSGSGIGVFIFPVLVEYLLSQYGWRVTFGVIGGIFLVVGTSCGLILKPKLKQNNDIVSSEETKTIDDSIMVEKSEQEVCSLNYQKTYGTILEKQNSNGYHQQHEQIDKNDTLRLTTAKETVTNMKVENQKYNKCCGEFKRTITDLFDMTIFKNPIIFLFAIPSLTSPFSLHITFTFLPERAIWLGTTHREAASLISVVGLSNLFSRPVAGILATRFPATKYYVVGLLLLFRATLEMMVSLFDTYMSMVMYMIIFGITSGAVASVFPVVLVDTLGVEYIEKALAINMVASAVGYILASPMAGLIIQETNDINLPFEVAGCIGLFGTIVYFLALCFIPKYGYKILPETKI